MVEISVLTLDEWASELPNRTVYVVGFGEFVSSLSETTSIYIAMIKVNCIAVNKGGTTVPRPF